MDNFFISVFNQIRDRYQWERSSFDSVNPKPLERQARPK